MPLGQTGKPFSDVVDLALTPTPAAAAMARRHVRDLPIDQQTVEVVSLLVTELVTNALRHADHPPSTIDVRLDSTPERVRIDVSNPGRGFEWNREDAKPGETGGMGLILVDKLAARWGVEGDGCTHVWLEIDRPQHPA